MKKTYLPRSADEICVVCGGVAIAQIDTECLCARHTFDYLGARNRSPVQMSGQRGRAKSRRVRSRV